MTDSQDRMPQGSRGLRKGSWRIRVDCHLTGPNHSMAMGRLSPGPLCGVQERVDGMTHRHKKTLEKVVLSLQAQEFSNYLDAGRPLHDAQLLEYLQNAVRV